MIHLLSPDWLDELCRIEHESFSDPWSAEMLLGELINPQAIYLGANKNDRLAGYAGMQIILDEGHIHNVAVSPEFRRCGIAISLVNALIEISRERNLSVIYLEVRESNLPAISLYKNLGFDIVGKRPNYYHNPHEAALLMTKNL